MKIAIQGEPGSFSHEAALKLVPGAEIVPCALSAEVFSSLSGGSVDAAVIPIENSLAGSVLIAMPGVKTEEIERVFSHPVALAQCRHFLAAHTSMRSFAFYDTAGSVKHVMELGDRHAAGVASEGAARYYGAQVLQADIEDNPENYTRFFLVRRAAEAQTDPASNKISIAFSVEHRPGSLVAALAALANEGTNLTKIESRPIHGRPWEYVFYVDCQIGYQIGSGDEGTRALKALAEHCGMVKELGRYRENREQGSKGAREQGTK
jgi:prephenate dehydratase